MPAPTCVCSAWARLSPSVTWPTLPSAREQGTPKSPFSASRRPPPSTSCWTFSWWASWPWEPWARPTPQWPLREPPFCCPSPLGRGQDGAVSRRPRFTLRRQPLAAIVKIGLPTALQMMVVNLSYCILAGMCNIRRVCRRRGRHRAEGKYLGRHAVLVPGPGGNRHGGAEHWGGRHGPCAENHPHGPLVRSGQHPDSPAAGTPFFSSHSPAVWIRQPGGPLRRGSLLSDLLRRQQPVLHCHVPP